MGCGLPGNHLLRAAVPVIKNGVSHRFGAAERTPIEVALPPGRYAVSDLYSHRRIVVKLTEELVAVELNEPFSAAAFLLTQIE